MAQATTTYQRRQPAASVLHPVELLERLAALTPRPRVNLILYHGVLGARAAWRTLVVRFGTTDDPKAREDSPAADDRRPGRNYLWADLMRRSLGLDVLHCLRCGGAGFGSSR